MLFAVFIVLFGVSSTALTTFGKSPQAPPPPPTPPPGIWNFYLFNFSYEIRRGRSLTIRRSIVKYSINEIIFRNISMSFPL